MPVEPKTPTPQGTFWTAAMNTPTNQAQAPAGGPTPAPAPAPQPSGSNVATIPQLTQDQLNQILQLWAKPPSSHHVITLDAPRTGGKSNTGVWVGRGLSQLGQSPASGYCYREFYGDPLKNFATKTNIEEKCQQGLKGKGEPCFAAAGETGHDDVMLTFRAKREYDNYFGFDDLALIVTSDGTTIDMLQTPGMVNETMVDSWVEDLLTNGVSKGNGARHPPCKLDALNLLWGGKACLNSCTDHLQLMIREYCHATGRELYYPIVQHQISMLTHRPSIHTVRMLVTKLEALDIRKFAGENVRLYVAEATLIVNEIQLNLTLQNQEPTLSSSALKGLTHSSDSYFRTKVMDTLLKADENVRISDPKHKLTPHAALQALLSTYMTLENTGAYGPSKQPGPGSSLKALQTQVDNIEAKLAQNRNAPSTTGNRGPPNNRPGGAGSSGGTGTRCSICGGHHSVSNCNLEERAAATGLSKEVLLKLPPLIKAKVQSLPPRGSVPDEAKHSIELDGVIVAKYCDHCGRFTKGNKAHYTSEHSGNRKRTFVPASGPAPAPTPAPVPSAGGHMMQITPPTSPPPQDVGSLAPGPMLRSGPDYGLHSLPSVSGGHLAQSDNFASAPSPPPSWLGTLGSDYPSLKGHGR